MTRRHGITSQTYKKMLFDSGAVYTGFVSLASPGTLLGATRGGSVFKRDPKYIDLAYEGTPHQVKGQRHLVGVKVTLDVNIISFDPSNLINAFPNALATQTDTNEITIDEDDWDNFGVHTLSNIALVAELSGSSDPVVLILDNPICESDFSLSFQDKGEATSKWTFSAFHDGTLFSFPSPWRILWPGTATIIEIEETGVAGDTYTETGTAANDIIESGV